MTFENINGTGKVRIGIFGGQYFAFVRPLTFLWDDNQGSIGFYLCSLPYSKEYRDEVHKSISDNLTNDYTNDIYELYKLLYPIWSLFSNGNYELNFYNSTEHGFFKITNRRDPQPYYTDWNIHFGYLTKKEEEETKRREYEEFLKSPHYPLRILDFTTYNPYPEDIVFIATQPKENIDLKTVKLYESQILNGDRPFAIVFNCSIPREVANTDGTLISYPYKTENFIIDGHHKLLAYFNLKIYPPIAELTFLPRSKKELEIAIPNVAELFYSWQAADILSTVR